MASTTDNRYSMTADATPGASLTAPAFSVIPYTSGMAVQVKSQKVEFGTMMPNGASAGQTNTAYWPEVSLSGTLCRDTSYDLVFQSALRGPLVAKVITPGSVARPFAVEKTVYEELTTLYRQARGVQTSTFEIKWADDAEVSVTGEGVGTSVSHSTTMSNAATYIAPSNTKKLTGTDVTVTIGALTGLQLKKGSISYDHAKKPQTICGSTAAIGVGTSGVRKITYSFTFYMRDWAIVQATLTGNPMAVAVNLGGVNTGYKFESAAVTFDAAQDEDDDSGQLVTITGTAAYDGTALADLKITQL